MVEGFLTASNDNIPGLGFNDARSSITLSSNASSVEGNGMLLPECMTSRYEDDVAKRIIQRKED
jgi:hypothetical protein